MKRLVLAAALLAAGSAMADLVARNGKNELRLMHSPCVHGGTLGHLKEEWRSQFRKAQASIEGKTLFACWIDTGEGAYFVIWEDGTSNGYPVAGFLDVPTI